MGKRGISDAPSNGARGRWGAGGPLDAAVRALADWFQRSSRVLPWRSGPEPYAVWVSEIMLQQTQVAAVRPFFERFLERFPTVETLAAASEAEVTLAWAGLGYYSRARNLLKAARQVVAAGGFPRNRAGWEALPGVGPYTAGAVLSIAYDQPEALLDGNVERVWSRLRRMERDAPRAGVGRSDAAYKARLWRLSRFWVHRAHALGIAPSTINQALMELGALVCVPRNPRCGICPLASICRARASGDAAEFPRKKKRPEWRLVSETVICVMDARGNVRVRLRQPGEWRAGLWDFPAVGETRLQSARYVGEAQASLVVTRHKITRVVKFYAASAPDVAQAAGGAADWAWVNARKPELATGSSFKKTVRSLLERFPEAWPQS